jgi:hypothetical protein
VEVGERLFFLPNPPKICKKGFSFSFSRGKRGYKKKPKRCILALIFMHFFCKFPAPFIKPLSVLILLLSIDHKVE